MSYRRINMCHIFLLAILLSFYVPVLATAQGSTLPQIEYAYPDQSVWTIRTDPSGKLDNPLLQVAEALFTQAGISWGSHAYPAGRMLQRLSEGTSSFSMLVRASTLKDDCLFSKLPITYTELRIYRMKNSSPVTKIEDLTGKDLIAIRGYSYGAIGKFFRNPDNGVTFYETDHHESAFDMLRYARAEYLLDYTGPSEEVLAESPISDVTFDVLSRLDVYLVLSKKYPNAANVLTDLEQIAQTLDVSNWGLKTP